MTQLIRTFNRSGRLLPKCPLQAASVRNLFVTVKRFEEEKRKNEIIKLDPVELATGMYKRDIIDRLGGEHDPYSVKTLAHGPGTKENPNMIPSAFESRMIGCICEEDSATIVWMWLHKGEPKRCQCGFWFKLYYEAPFPEQSLIPT